MNVTEALELADEWTKGYTFYKSQDGWRVAVGVLAEEVQRLQQAQAAMRLLWAGMTDSEGLRITGFSEKRYQYLVNLALGDSHDH